MPWATIPTAPSTSVAARPVVLGVDRPAADIDRRVAATYDEQVRRGLRDEVLGLDERYDVLAQYRRLGQKSPNQVVHTHGYTEWFDVALDRGKPVENLTAEDLAEVRERVVERIRTHTRRQRSAIPKLTGRQDGPRRQRRLRRGEGALEAGPVKQAALAGKARHRAGQRPRGRSRSDSTTAQAGKAAALAADPPEREPAGANRSTVAPAWRASGRALALALALAALRVARSCSGCRDGGRHPSRPACRGHGASHRARACPASTAGRSCRAPWPAPACLCPCRSATAGPPNSPISTASESRLSRLVTDGVRSSRRCDPCRFPSGRSIGNITATGVHLPFSGGCRPCVRDPAGRIKSGRG